MPENSGAPIRAVLRALAAFALFPNLLFLLIGVFLYTDRAPINVDYLVLGALWLWLPFGARVASFALLFVLDAVGSTALMYNTHPLTGIVALMKAPIGLIAVVILGFLIAVGVATSIGYFAVHYLSDRRRKYLIFGVLSLLAVVMLPTHIAASSALKFARDLRDRIVSASPQGFPVQSASESMRKDPGATNIALILVESLGQIKDQQLARLVWEPLTTNALEEHYDIQLGGLPFRGGTTSGELRELCGIFADYITVPASVFDQCLPRVLHERGYTTYALHGFRLSYYDRDKWYPLLFDSIYFEANLESTASAQRCGTQFRGICDRDVFRSVERVLLGGEKRFVYWLTMDAHTPVEVARRREFQREWKDLRLDDLPVCRRAPEVCLQALFWRNSFQRIAGLAVDPRLPPTRFLIVGDHAPAYVRRSRAEAFVPGRVPYAELRPR